MFVIFILVIKIVESINESINNFSLCEFRMFDYVYFIFFSLEFKSEVNQYSCGKSICIYFFNDLERDNYKIL